MKEANANLLLKKKNVKDRVDALEAEVASTEDEIEEVKSLKTCIDLVDHIRQLEEDCLAFSEESFNETVAQLRIVNPGVEFTTTRISLLHNVEEGRIIVLDLLKIGGEDACGDQPSQEEPLLQPV